MRVKLQCLPPLPALKLWYAVEGDKIEDLKKSLAKNLPGLGPAVTGLQLLLDDFELLDWQSTRDILRDGDLLVVKRLEKVSAPPTATQQTTKPAAGKKRKRAPSASSSSSSSDSSDDTSSDSSDDTSDSDDDSDSDDTSSSDSSSNSDSDDEAPLVQSSKRLLKPPPAKKPAVATKPPAVTPPGQGKTTTRERNRRRRAQRLRQSQGGGDIAMAPPPKALSMTNGTPLGAPSSVGGFSTGSMANALAGSMFANEDLDAPLPDATDHSAPMAGMPDYSELTMFSLRNKNKSKNFRKNLKMQVPAGPKRIVFAHEAGAGQVQGGAATSQAQDGAATSQAQNGAATSKAQAGLYGDGAAASKDGTTSSKTQANRHQARLPRLVPPSERTDLPPNVFVTSVDVEAGWEADTSGYQYDTSAYNKSYVQENQDEANIQLSYDDDDAAPSFDTTTNASTSPYPALAQSYASATASQPVASLAQLDVGKHVGWTSLELNAATMTPEVMVVIAKVVALDDDGESGESTRQTVTVKRIPKPLEGEAHELLLNVAGEGEEEEEQEEETFTLKEAVDAGWRVIL